MPNEIILLSRSDIESLMPFGEYVDAVAEAFRLHAEGRAVSAPASHPGGRRGLHVKSASLPLGRRYVAIKTNSNFPQNRSRGPAHHPGRNPAAGRGRRTPWPSSIPWKSPSSGPRYGRCQPLSRATRSRTGTICGCGEQGRIQLAALRHALDIERYSHGTRTAPLPDLRPRCPSNTASM